MQEVRDRQAALRTRLAECPDFRWLRPLSIVLPLYAWHRRWVFGLTALVGLLLLLIHQGRWLAGPVAIVLSVRVAASIMHLPWSRLVITRGLFSFWLVVAVLVVPFGVNPIVAALLAVVTVAVICLSAMASGAGIGAIYAAFVPPPPLDENEAARASELIDTAHTGDIDLWLRLLLVAGSVFLAWALLLTLVLATRPWTPSLL